MSKRELSPAWSVTLGCTVIVLLVVDVFLKNPADRQELMWACYWASISVAAGMIFRVDVLVSAGTVFLAGLGLPTWLLGTFMDSQMEATSVLLHVIPLVAGLLYLTKVTALPKYSAAGAWLLYVVPFGLAWRFCTPDAMINLSHWTRWPVPSVLPHTWQFYVLLMSVSAVMVIVAAGMLDSLVARNSISRQAKLRAGVRANHASPSAKLRG